MTPLSPAASWLLVVGGVLLLFGGNWLWSVLVTRKEKKQLDAELAQWEPGRMYYSRYRSPKHEEEK